MSKQETAEAKLVFAQENLVLHDKDGLPFRLIGGQPWRADDPLVKRHPGNFGERPPYQFMGRSTPPDPSELPEYMRHVEQATQEPGEVRV